MTNRLYSIGHSNHQIDAFIGLLRRHEITALVDVRSDPYSGHHPQFNMEVVQQSLEQAGIVYLFLGKELGARSDNPQCYVDGKVRYELLSQEASFQEGIARVLRELERYSIALMCAEGDPLKCHRTILVGRELRKRDVGLHHILPDGSLESHRDTEKRLLSLLRLPESELFRTHEEIIADAYAIQGQRIAYVNKGIGRSISEVHT